MNGVVCYVGKLLAARFPKPNVADLIRRLPNPNVESLPLKVLGPRTPSELTLVLVGQTHGVPGTRLISIRHGLRSPQNSA